MFMRSLLVTLAKDTLEILWDVAVDRMAQKVIGQNNPTSIRTWFEGLCGEYIVDRLVDGVGINFEHFDLQGDGGFGDVRLVTGQTISVKCRDWYGEFTGKDEELLDTWGVLVLRLNGEASQFYPQFDERHFLVMGIVTQSDWRDHSSLSLSFNDRIISRDHMRPPQIMLAQISDLRNGQPMRDVGEVYQVLGIPPPKRRAPINWDD